MKNRYLKVLITLVVIGACLLATGCTSKEQDNNTLQESTVNNTANTTTPVISNYFAGEDLAITGMVENGTSDIVVTINIKNNGNQNVVITGVDTYFDNGLEGKNNAKVVWDDRKEILIPGEVTLYVFRLKDGTRAFVDTADGQINYKVSVFANNMGQKEKILRAETVIDRLEPKEKRNLYFKIVRI